MTSTPDKALLVEVARGKKLERLYVMETRKTRTLTLKLQEQDREIRRLKDMLTRSEHKLKEALSQIL